MQEAVDLALEYTPFPATVCGYLCPNLCMQNCTRQKSDLPAVDTALLGRASLQAAVPTPAAATGMKIAVIGGGAAGLSVAWQLRMKGHEADHPRCAQKARGKDHRDDPHQPDPRRGGEPRAQADGRGDPPQVPEAPPDRGGVPEAVRQVRHRRRRHGGPQGAEDPRSGPRTGRRRPRFPEGKQARSRPRSAKTSSSSARETSAATPHRRRPGWAPSRSR